MKQFAIGLSVLLCGLLLLPNEGSAQSYASKWFLSARKPPALKETNLKKFRPKAVDDGPRTSPDGRAAVLDDALNGCGWGYREILEGLNPGFFDEAAGKCREFVSEMKAGVMTRKGTVYLVGESRLCHSVNPQVPADAVCLGEGVYAKPFLHTAYLCQWDRPLSAYSPGDLPQIEPWAPWFNVVYPPDARWCSDGFSPRGHTDPNRSSYVCQSDTDEFQDFIEDDPGKICGSSDMEIAYVQGVSNGGILHCCGTVFPLPIK